jgi:hypothetical protein
MEGRKDIARSNQENVEVYKVTIEADKQRCFSGESVYFKGRIQPVRERVLYRFDFGDGEKSDWLRTPMANHTFGRPGTYTASLTTRIEETFLQSDEIAIYVEVPDFDVFIEADPNRTKLGQRIFFRTTIEPSIDGIEYQFFFGDGEVRDWSVETQTEHVYSRRDTYQAYVEARFGEKRSTSNPIIIIIDGFHRLMLMLVIIVGVVVLLCVGCYRYLNTKEKEEEGERGETKKLRVQYIAKKDPGSQNIKSRTSRQLYYDVRLRPNMDQGVQHIGAKDSLIRCERRDHE